MRVCQIAADYRQQFKADVVVDIFCYRRHGHNEGDEPAFTQPAMYRAIRERLTTRPDLYRAAGGRGRAHGQGRRPHDGDLPRPVGDRARSLQELPPQQGGLARRRLGGHRGRTPRRAARRHRRGARGAGRDRPRPSPACRTTSPCTRASAASWRKSARRWRRAARSTGRRRRHWPWARCCWRGSRSGSPARTVRAAHSPSAMRAW